MKHLGNWLEMYRKFEALIDRYGAENADTINHMVDNYHERHKGDPAVEEAHRRWCEDYDECIEGAVDPDKRTCDRCGALLCDDGSCPVCDHGEEDYDEPDEDDDGELDHKDIKTSVFAAKGDYSDAAQWAEDLANEIADFLNFAGRLPNRDNYLDDYDMEDIGKTYDALVNFADSWSADHV